MDSPSRLLSNAIQSTEDGSNWGIDNDKSGGRAGVDVVVVASKIVSFVPQYFSYPPSLSLPRICMPRIDPLTAIADREGGRMAARFLDRITMSGIMIKIMLELGRWLGKMLLGRFRELLSCFFPNAAWIRKPKSCNLEIAVCSTLPND